ncbi:MAG: hypothetical protein KDA89_10515, partial [Planctomycetaceae bacterium]|nr:hypothetical protein [Planctomycetaceae bacterium]
TLCQLRAVGKTVMAVAASACATPTGAFDRLTDIADVCRRHGVWLHTDAAHGGGVLMSRRHRHLLAGLECSDSAVWDAHKMLFVPALCAAVLYRHGDVRFQTFRQDAPYLFNPSDPGAAVYDSGTFTFECTKRSTGFGLWGLWSLFGESLFEDLVDRTFSLAATLYALLENAEDFVPFGRPEANIVVFRHVPQHLRDASPETQNDFQKHLRRSLVQSGKFYIVQTTLDDIVWLRAVVMNPLTTPTDLSELLDTLRTVGDNDRRNT